MQCDTQKQEDDLSFDHLLKTYIGTCGRWHRLTILMLLIPMSVPLSLFPVFSHITPPHRCRIPLLDIKPSSNSSLINLTYSQKTELTIPIKPDQNMPPMIGQTYQPCQRYTMGWLVDALRLTNGSFEALLEFRNSQWISKYENSTEPCRDGHVYDTFERENQGTVIEDFNLVCDQTFWDPLATTIFLVIKSLILPIGGFISDKIGRKKVLCIFLLLNAITVIVTSFSPSIIWYVFLRSAVALCTVTNYTQGFIYFMEMTTSFHRNALSTLSSLCYGILGLSVYTALSYMLPTWRWVHCAFALGYLPVIPLLWWIPESPRWLLATGREKEAFKAIKFITKINKSQSPRSLTDEQLKSQIQKLCAKLQLNHQSNRKSSILSTMVNGIKNALILLRKPKLRFRTIVLAIFWLHVSMDYYMMSFVSTKMAGNAYLNFWLICVSATLPAAVIQYLLTWKVGRKLPTVVLTYMMVAIFLGVVIYQVINTGNDHNVALLFFLGLGKVFIEATFGIIYIYTPELYSTDVGSYGMGICKTFGCIGSALAPIIVHLGSTTWRPIPIISATLLSFVAASGICALPETSNTLIHATVEELEATPGDSLFEKFLSKRIKPRRTHNGIHGDELRTLT